eukprot:NODE_850_length_3546_cov_0.564549.p1 type:complete len:715 gc:universal NODE_850_length_3546_cov_0.564549:473-2617(+)
MSSALKSMLMLYLVSITRLYAISTDCPVIFNFLQGLNLHLTDPALYQSIPTNCCNYSNYAFGYFKIVCSGTGASERVTGLTASFVHVNGTIKSQFLPSSLTLLEIYDTPLNTTIPNDLPGSITTISLYDNQLRGSIPNTLPSQLDSFFVNNNQLTGLPDSFPNTLLYLYLDENLFDKLPILPPNLRDFSISGNLLTRYPTSFPSTLIAFRMKNTLIGGAFPTNFPASLERLTLSNNRLQGIIPSLPPQLIQLYAEFNFLTGLSYDPPKTMKTLYLNHNLFTKMPILPPHLELFDISNNKVFDKMPSSFPVNLVEFSGEYNQLYGPIPPLPSPMDYLSLSYNQLNGTFPILSDSIVALLLDYNLLTGSLPNTWPPILYSLNVANNKMSGNLSGFNSSKLLNFINLSMNSFSGNLPILNLMTYSMLDLSHNQLYGDIDLNYTYIEDLRLSFNKFTNYPKSLPLDIKTLKLDNNQMSGNIKYDLPSSLTTIDLSNNNLTGFIPNWQNNINPIYFNISNNSITGTIPKSLQNVSTLDISHNYLSGCIDYPFSGSNFYLNDNYLSGNFSFVAPSQLYLQNNYVNDVVISNATVLTNCSLANNPMAPGVFGKTFKNQCILTGIFANSQSTCRILTMDEILHQKIFTTTHTIETTAMTTAATSTTFEAIPIDTTNSLSEISSKESDITLFTRNLLSFRSNHSQSHFSYIYNSNFHDALHDI